MRSESYNFQNFVDQYGSNLKKILLLESCHDTALMLTHNVLSKAKRAHLFKNSMYHQISIDDPTWQVRQKLSRWFERRHSVYDTWHRAHGPNVLTLKIIDFVQDPLTSLVEVMPELDFQIDRSRIEPFKQIVEEWRSLQKFLSIDKTVQRIVDCTVNNVVCDWSSENLSIIDEAFVQMLLRHLHKLDLRCYNLNVFPTNTESLRKLLINE
jgi:hypothetical protein